MRMTLGQNVNVMGSEATVKDVISVEEIDYELYMLESGAGAIRVYDTEVDEVACLLKFPEFAKAKIDYAEAVRMAILAN